MIFLEISHASEYYSYSKKEHMLYYINIFINQSRSEYLYTLASERKDGVRKQGDKFIGQLMLDVWVFRVKIFFFLIKNCIVSTF